MAALVIAVPVAQGNGAASSGWTGGAGTLFCDGAAAKFNGGTITIQVQRTTAGGDWQTGKDTAGDPLVFTAAGHTSIFYPAGTLFRAVRSVADGAADVSCVIEPAYASVREAYRGNQ